eukprot:scaffold537_cov175-Amphora_coffeaeformis.AAC.4
MRISVRSVQEESHGKNTQTQHSPTEKPIKQNQGILMHTTTLFVSFQWSISPPSSMARGSRAVAMTQIPTAIMIRKNGWAAITTMEEDRCRMVHAIQINTAKETVAKQTLPNHFHDPTKFSSTSNGGNSRGIKL